jgi:uncharacterized protein YjbI with pentapeptide repeats
MRARSKLHRARLFALVAVAALASGLAASAQEIEAAREAPAAQEPATQKPAPPAATDIPPSRALDLKGEALMEEGRHQEALAAFAAALAIEAANGRALLLSAETRRRAAEGAGGPGPARTPVELAGLPLEAQDLARLSLSGLEIRDAHAPRSNWSFSRVEDSAFVRAQMSGADLAGAQFLGVSLDGAVLDGARLKGASLAGSSLTRARAHRLISPSASFAAVRARAAEFDGSIFRQADFVGADLRASRFGAADFTGASLLNADLRGADLSRAVLVKTDLRGARVDCNTRLPKGIDPEASLLVPLDLCGGLYALDYRGRQLAGISFRDLDLRGGLFGGASLGGVDFAGANLDGADFEAATGFEAANFAPASAREANFEKIPGPLGALEGADMRNARLSGLPGAPLELTLGPAGPRLDGAQLTQVRLVLDHRLAAREPSAPGGAVGLAGLLRARFEAGIVECARAPTARGPAAESLAEWTLYAETLETARRVVAASPGVLMGETCRRAIENVLGDNCERGRKLSGARFACPARR